MRQFASCVGVAHKPLNLRLGAMSWLFMQYHTNKLLQGDNFISSTQKKHKKTFYVSDPVVVCATYSTWYFVSVLVICMQKSRF